MKFFEFSQNNSGGHFDVDDKVTHRVLIEAESADEATRIAESLGMYWNGCDEGMDCPCCGDRWYAPWSNDGKVFPFAYGSFGEKEANSICENYDAELKKRDKESIGGPRWDVLFKTPEKYMQYLADAYGWTKPDGYIYYKDGRKVSIYSKKVK